MVAIRGGVPYSAPGDHPKDELPRVALVDPGIEQAGGITAVALFLARVLRESGRYRPALVSPPLASDDPSSLRILSPSTWLRGVRTCAILCSILAL